MTAGFQAWVASGTPLFHRLFHAVTKPCPTRRLRLLGIIEGISWLTLLLVAMPLKYAAGVPEAVSAVGMIHGVLFVWFFFELAVVHLQLQWPMGLTATVGISAVLPFGFLWIDRRLKGPESPGAGTPGV